jgi:RNA polymerase sigma-70 factor, ECF subfamily
MVIVNTPKPRPADEPDVAWDEVRTELRAFVARRVSDREAVEDLVQEVLVRLHATLSRGTGIVNLPAWLHRVTRNAIIDHYRSRRRQEALDEATALADVSSWPYPGDDDAEDRPAFRELVQCLRPFIDRLPGAYRDALVLTDLDGMTQASAAAALGLSVSGMKSRVQRARLQLRALLEDCCPVEVDHRGVVVDFARPNERCDCAATDRLPERPRESVAGQLTKSS